MMYLLGFYRNWLMFDFSQRAPVKVGNNLNFVDLLRAIQDLVQHCHF